MKDPAFLFYSKEFYEGTRMMLPEERACYVDLMIYQHQNGGFIPDNIKRLMMYCSGVDEATLKATLEAKFKRCDKGWYNQKLSDVISERKAYSEKQSHNGIIGQFWKHAKKELKKKDFDHLKKWVYEDYGKEKLISVIQKNNQDYGHTLQGLLKQCLSIYANANSISDSNEDSNEKNKRGVGEKKEEIPSLEDFVAYANENCGEAKLNQLAIKNKYLAWKENNWKDGNGRPVKNWKSKLLNTIPHIPLANQSTNHKTHANAKSQHRLEPAKDGFGSF